MPVLRRFPFALWAPVFLGSVFILNGAHPRVEPLQLGIGLALTVAPFALAVYLAIGPWRGRPGASLVHAWFLGGTAMFYVIIALAALVLLNGLYAVVCLLAGLWPMTAVALWIANSRNKTTGAGETPDDQSAADDAAMAPGIGAEDERPLGDTPEAHDEISHTTSRRATPADVPPSASPRTAKGRPVAVRREVPQRQAWSSPRVPSSRRPSPRKRHAKAPASGHSDAPKRSPVARRTGSAAVASFRESLIVQGEQHGAGALQRDASDLG